VSKKIPVLVTGVGGGGVGEQVVFALRAAETPYKIICVDMDPYSLGLQISDAGYVVPRATSEEYLDRILEVCKKESVKVLIPGSEAELFKIARNKMFFEDHGILPLINSTEIIELFEDKYRGLLFLQEKGFRVPLCKSFDEWDDSHYPLIVKPSLGSGGSRFVFVAQNREELTFFKGFLERNGCVPIFQEYVGSPDKEYTVGVLTSLDGDLMGSIAIRRRLVGRLSTLYSVKNYLPDEPPICISTGISQGEIQDFPEVRKNAERIALRIGSRGPINVQCRIAGEDIFVFEINPRFSGTESLRALAGYNAPDALIRKHILGEEVDGLCFKSGIALRGLFNYFMEDELD